MKNAVPPFMQSFSELVAAHSVSSIDPRFNVSNREVIELLANWFAGLGFKTEMQLVSTDPDKLNLIACLGEGEGGLVLSGHTDTVPFDENLWHQDPFQLIEKDNRLYGLGSTDMKVFFSVILSTLEKLDLEKIKRPLYVLATCDEESTMAGAKALVNSGQALGRYALIGEPTGLKPINMHKGILIESIKLIGRSGHSSDPALGVNALEGMHKVIQALFELRKDIQSQYRNDKFRVPVPTMNFASIRGGDNPNRICGECELTIDMRPLPNMNLEECRAEIRRAAMQAIDGSDLIIEFSATFEGSNGMFTDSESEIVQIAEKLAGQPTGTVAFGTEGPYFNSLGIDTVVMGPGDIDQAHQANEYVERDRIEPMVDILHNMIHHFCIRAD